MLTIKLTGWRRARFHSKSGSSATPVERLVRICDSMRCVVRDLFAFAARARRVVRILHERNADIDVPNAISIFVRDRCLCS